MTEQEVRDSDGALILEQGEAALITTDGMKGLSLMIPKSMPNKLVPDVVLFLTACMVRYHRDPEFVAEQVKWMHDRKPG